jgi:hypothetical protein
MDKIIFGDNQFFGINHLSETKALDQSIKFADDAAIFNTLQTAYELGIRTFMCTTHERIGAICAHFKTHQHLYPDFKFYPCMPYAHKYANAVTEFGILGSLQQFLPTKRALSSVLKSGVSLLKGELNETIKLLIDMEMKPFQSLTTPVIFLQNVVTDLLLGLNMRDAFKCFADHVTEKYGAEPGFITMNLPPLVNMLMEIGIKNPIVCANINSANFRMSGGKKLYEKTIKERQFRPIAMSIFASGAIPIDQAISYIRNQPEIRSVVFGASSHANISATIKMLGEFEHRAAPFPNTNNEYVLPAHQ